VTRSTFRHHESFELRVLAALATGATRPEEVAAGLNDTVEHVCSSLDWAVEAEVVSKLDLPAGPSYSLTPKGLEIVGLAQGVDAAVSPGGRVDLGAASRLVMQQYDAAREVAVENAERDQAGLVADDRARDQVTAALNDAYARGALTKDQLDERTGNALTATTLGELRAAAEGVVDLPPAPPAGLGPVMVTSQAPQVEINPGLRKVKWHHLLYAAVYVVIGLVVMILQPVVGALLILGGLVLGGYTLRPLLRSVDVTTR
jgi:hypothetical protein